MPGEWVEVRPASEILATLDHDHRLDGMPFMPEMVPHCGRRFRVALRAERTCVHPPQIPLRQLKDTVTLQGLRCDGASHGGCQLGCMIYWKEAWLSRVDGPAREPAPPGTLAAPVPLLRVTRRDDPAAYVCQGTELPRASTVGEPVWKPGQYLRFLRVGTFTPAELAAMIARIGFRKLARLATAPFRSGPAAGPARPAPSGAPPLEPGQWVEVKSRDEIAATLDARRTHKGLAFSSDMYAFCGRRLRVASRVTRILAEDTGRLRTVRHTVTLEGSICDRYLGCARGMPILWREAWLSPASAPGAPAPDPTPHASPGERRERQGRG